MITDFGTNRQSKAYIRLDGCQLGSCESFFCVRIESRIESAVYTTQAVTPSNELQGAPCRSTVWAYISSASELVALGRFPFLLFLSASSCFKLSIYRMLYGVCDTGESTSGTSSQSPVLQVFWHKLQT